MEHRILLVDDEHEAYELVRDVVDRHMDVPAGDSVVMVWAPSVEEGIEAIDSEGFPLVVCDIFFGDPQNPSAGVAVVQHAAAARDRRAAGGQVVVLTQYSTAARLVQDAHEAGADDFFGKHTPRRTLGRSFMEALGLGPGGSHASNGPASPHGQED